MIRRKDRRKYCTKEILGTEDIHVGDTVWVKSIEWYNTNKNINGSIRSSLSDMFSFIPSMSKCCGKKFVVSRMNNDVITLEGDPSFWFADWLEI